MPEPNAVFYGVDLAGTLANRPTNAPPGVAYFATDTEQTFISKGGGNWHYVDAIKDIAFDVDFVIGSESADVINVGIQLNDASGSALAAVSIIEAYLSDNADGLQLTDTVPDGDVAIGTDGTILNERVTDKFFTLQSEVDGDIDLDIGHSGVKTWYLAVLLSDGSLVVSDAITFA